jgi:hypothetical protein
MFSEAVAVYSENRTKHTNTVCGHNSEIVSVEAGSTQRPLTAEDVLTLNGLHSSCLFGARICFSRDRVDITCLNKRWMCTWYEMQGGYSYLSFENMFWKNCMSYSSSSVSKMSQSLSPSTCIFCVRDVPENGKVRRTFQALHLRCLSIDVRMILKWTKNSTPPSSEEVSNGGSIPPLPHVFSWRGA